MKHECAHPAVTITKKLISSVYTYDDPALTIDTSGATIPGFPAMYFDKTLISFTDNTKPLAKCIKYNWFQLNGSGGSPVGLVPNTNVPFFTSYGL